MAVGADSLFSNTTGSYNTALGDSALLSNTTASNNTAVGYQAGYTNTTGVDVVYIGYQAGYTATGNDNTYIGSVAGKLTTTGTANTAIGGAAGYSTTTGANNTSLGRQALFSNTTASNNTAVGYQAAYSNTTGAGVVAIGYAALKTSTTASYSVAIGFEALTTSTSTGVNTGVGLQALRFNTTGSENVAVGGGNGINYNATLGANTTGAYNTGVGFGALGLSTTASNSTAVGYQAGYSNTTASNNTAVGYRAGYNNIAGVGNTFIGIQAGYSSNATGDNGYNVAIGRQSGYSLTTGFNNTFLGANAGQLVTSGTKNTIVGQFDGNQGSLDIRTASNYIVLSDGDGNPRGYFNNSGDFYPSTRINLPNAASSSGQINFYNCGATTQVLATFPLSNQTITVQGVTDNLFFSSDKSGIGNILNMSTDGVTAIKFAASQSASADANVLDDYEEGTWTPLVGSDSTGGFTMSTVYGRYTKVGNMVTIICYASWSARPSGGSVAVTGFPFNINNFTGGGNIATTFITKSATDAVLTNTTLGYDGNGVSGTMYIYSYSRGGLIAVNSLSSAGFLAFTGTYFV